jgi:hypothetical protein
MENAGASRLPQSGGDPGDKHSARALCERDRISTTGLKALATKYFVVLTIPSVTLSSLSLALLRVNYRLARLPLQLVEDVAVARLDEQAPIRLAYEQILIECDRAAAYLLSDRKAANRATELTRRTASVRLLIAREHHRVQHRGVVLLDEQRERFHQRRQQGVGSLT